MCCMLERPAWKTVRPRSVERLLLDRGDPHDLHDPEVGWCPRTKDQVDALVEEHVVLVVPAEHHDPSGAVPDEGRQDVTDDVDERLPGQARRPRAELASTTARRRAIAVGDSGGHYRPAW